MIRVFLQIPWTKYYRSYDTAENGAEYTRGHETRSITALGHYLESWDLYKENINSNINYLEKVVNKCHAYPEDISLYLKRRPPQTK